MKLNDKDTQALVDRFLGYGRYDERPGAKPVTPIFYVNSAYSRDNSPEAYSEIVLPMLAKLNPRAARARHAIAGGHAYLLQARAEPSAGPCAPRREVVARRHPRRFLSPRTLTKGDVA